jgi:hypothetical protein
VNTNTSDDANLFISNLLSALHGPRAYMARDQPYFDWIISGAENDRNRRGRSLGNERASRVK